MTVCAKSIWKGLDGALYHYLRVPPIAFRQRATLHCTRFNHQKSDGLKNELRFGEFGFAKSLAMDPELIVLQLEVWALEIAVTKVGRCFRWKQWIGVCLPLNGFT